MVHPQRSWCRKSLAASLSPVHYSAISLLWQRGQTPEILKSDGERGINLSHTLGKIKLWSGTDEVPCYTGQQKTSAQGKRGGLCCCTQGAAGSWQHLLLLGVARGQHIIQFILMPRAATLLSSTAKDLRLSFSTAFLNTLPQFCVQQSCEGPEHGLLHQPVPLPQARCSSHTVPGDLLWNLIQLSMISWRFDAPDKCRSRCFPLKFPLWEFSRDWYLLEARFKTGYFFHFLLG